MCVCVRERVCIFFVLIIFTISEIKIFSADMALHKLILYTLFMFITNKM